MNYPGLTYPAPANGSRAEPVRLVTLAPGHYVVICNLPGHYASGMHADLTVR